MIIEKKVCRRPTLWLVMAYAVMGLTGCTSAPVTLDTPEHEALLKKDRLQAEQGDPQQVVTLTLEDAIMRGMVHNLDAQVSALEVLVGQKNVTLEKLKALPSITASRGYSSRNNDGASSSRSVLSGLQSLEPSQSTDQDRQVSALEANWNLVDIALAYADAKRAGEEVGIAAERHEKVIQNVQRDVYAAYWRAYAHQETRDATRAIIADAKKQSARLDQAVQEKLISADAAADQAVLLADRMRALKELDDRLNLSEIELKSMLSLPLSSKLLLKKPEGRETSYKSLLSENIEAQEWEALKSRPELREEILQKNITLRDTKREALSTFPGLELFAGWNYDDNSFLQDSTWIMSSAKIVQNLLSILTLPSRYDAAKNKEALADSRRHALVAAVLAQTSMARARLQTREMFFNDTAASLKTAVNKDRLLGHKAQAGMASRQASLQARLEKQIEVIRHHISQADLQDAYAAYMNTIGRRFFQPVNLVHGGRT